MTRSVREFCLSSLSELIFDMRLEVIVVFWPDYYSVSNVVHREWRSVPGFEIPSTSVLKYLFSTLSLDPTLHLIGVMKLLRSTCGLAPSRLMTVFRVVVCPFNALCVDNTKSLLTAATPTRPQRYVPLYYHHIH